MKTNYFDFLKINEQKESIVSLFDVENVIKKIFNDVKVSSVNSLYELDEDGILKLIITINNLFFEDTNIIHTKFIFYPDDNKRKLNHNYFYYLYDINCNFKKVSFNDSLELEDKLNNIINNKKFGRDLKTISDLNISMATNVNELLNDNDINDISVYTITYSPIVNSVPCESLTFKFDINIDDIRYIKMVVKKISNTEYKLSFNENDWFFDVEIGSIKAIPQTITDVIKKYIK